MMIFLLCLSFSIRAQVPDIDMERAFNQKSQLLLSDFIERIEYVILETKGHPTGGGLKVYTSGSYLVCIAWYQIYLFDRQTGKFVREIGKFGKGPGEYLSAGYFDSNTQHVITMGNGRDFNEYDLNGKMIRSILRPRKEIVTKAADGIFSDDWVLNRKAFLDKNTVVYYNENISGNAKDRMIIADDKGKVLKIFANPNSFVRSNMAFTLGQYDYLYHYDGNTLFFENCVDTIYRVTGKALIPHYHLKMGKYKPPYGMKSSLIVSTNDPNPLRNQYFMLDNIGESDHFLFFNILYQKDPTGPVPWSQCSFFGYSDKKSGQTKIANIDGMYRKRIVNDIDNFSAIRLDSWTVNEHNEMITYIEAGDVLDWFENNPEKADLLPAHLQKLSKLKPEDNPVIVIAKLKPN
jgi:hypothetical protein